MEVKSDLDKYSPKLKIEFSWQLLHQQYWLFMLILNIRKFFQFDCYPPKTKNLRKFAWFLKKKGWNIPQKSSDLIENPCIRYIILENPTVEVSSHNLRNVKFPFFSEETSSIHIYFFCPGVIVSNPRSKVIGRELI